MNRRNYLRGIGVAGCAVTTGGVALHTLTGTGRAGKASSEIGDATVTTDKGTILYVATSGDISFTWSNLPTAVTHYSIQIDVSLHEDDGGEIGSQKGTGSKTYFTTDSLNEAGGKNGSYTYTFGRAAGGSNHVIAADPDFLTNGLAKRDGLQAVFTPPFDTTLFEAATDGETERTWVIYDATFAVYDTDPGNNASTTPEPQIADSTSATLDIVIKNKNGSSQISAEANTGVADDSTTSESAENMEVDHAL